MIRETDCSHHPLMDASELVVASVAGAPTAPAERNRHARITAIVRAEHDFIWRLLRRVGVPEASVDDATQQVFCIAARRVDDIKPGSERSFLFGAALRVASDRRRSREARVHHRTEPDEEMDPSPSPEELAETRQRRAI